MLNGRHDRLAWPAEQGCPNTQGLIGMQSLRAIGQQVALFAVDTVRSRVEQTKEMATGVELAIRESCTAQTSGCGSHVRPR